MIDDDSNVEKVAANHKAILAL